jgi:hypothetical protein
LIGREAMTILLPKREYLTFLLIAFLEPLEPMRPRH